MRLAKRDVIVNVEEPGGFAGLVEPDQRRADDEEHLHRLVIFIGDQRVALAGRLIDEVAGRRRPIMLQIAPFARDRIGHHLMG